VPGLSGQSQSAWNFDAPTGPQHNHSSAVRLKVKQNPAEANNPVAEFCAALRRLQELSGVDRTVLARRLAYSRSQLYAILDGRIGRPPEWDRLVDPLVRLCTCNDEQAVALWRRRHEVLVEVYHALRHQTRRDIPPKLTRTARVVPAQLPADVDVFTGRVQELAELDRLAAGTSTQVAGDDPTTVVIAVISGTAGVGKTALALRWAHRVREQYPDGQLYVNLRGYDPDQPVSAGDVLARFLRALGMAAQEIPRQVDERAAVYRSLLNGRRVVVMLDNAATVEQVRPLLPGTASCLVVVTSRDSLAGLVARNGARRLNLDLLPSEDTIALLRALIGERIDTEPEAAVTLAKQCIRLPLALRVAAELAAARPGASLAELVTELGDQQRRLEMLNAGGDPRTAIRAVFSWSYQHLPAGAARMFRLIGLHPGPDLDPYAAAILANVSLQEAQQQLDLLSCAHLIELTRSSRYGMHDLLRAYATYLASIEDPEDKRWAALTRLFDYYLCSTAAAMDTLFSAELHRQPRIPAPARTIPSLVHPAAALAWLNTERTTLTTACAYMAARGWHQHTIQLATTLWRYLHTGGHYHDALTIHTHALMASRHIGDLASEAHALNDLSSVYWQQGRYQQANDHLQQALALHRQVGDRAGEASALGSLGTVYERLGRYQQANDHLQQALALHRQVGDRAGEARTLNDLGETQHAVGQVREAHIQHTTALTVAIEINDRYEQARAHNRLGHTYYATDDPHEAGRHCRHALTLYTDLGVPEPDGVRIVLNSGDERDTGAGTS
jgi:tetratricopeptide (TPR) repeat protein